ncbi:Acyltransferase family protein [compost metagenome]
MKRENSIDIVRGIVMIIMALDHVRDLMHVDALTQSPTDLTTTTPILFFTRWITHLCAPIFVFLAGTSVYLSLKSKNNIAEMRKHLIKRGFWLVLLEFTIVNFGLFFDIGFHTLLFEVIATIGFGFILLGLLLKIPTKQLGILGLIIIFCHNIFPLIPFAEGSLLKTILAPFFNLTVIPLFAGKVFVVGYPPIPWLGIMLVGFASGRFFEKEKSERKKLFVKIGLGSLGLFTLIRFINIYGDPALWSVQKNALFTFLSFMNLTKYPPSLLFCLVTLGILFLLLAFADQFNSGIRKVTSVYGKVPLFYFVVHFYVIHVLTLVMLLFQGFNWSQFEFATGTFGRPENLKSGVSLLAIYLIWMSVVTILYKPCIWFGKYKTRNSHWWLRYI